MNQVLKMISLMLCLFCYLLAVIEIETYIFRDNERGK